MGATDIKDGCDMKNIWHNQWSMILMFFCWFTSCSTTKNLPEGETLYAGIKDITFGKQDQNHVDEKTKGVITALADAYETVDSLLTGSKEIQKKEISKVMEQQLTQKQLDSLDQERKLIEAAYDRARTEAEAALAYAPNNSLMGSSKWRHPFALRLWIYNAFVGARTKLGHWIFNQFAATPVLISTVNPEVRTKVAQNVLRNNGFFNARVGYELVPLKKKRQAKINYAIDPGRIYRLDSIAYIGFDEGLDTLIRRSAKSSLLKKGDQFSAANLDGERQRLSTLFRNSGRYYYKPEYITFRADTFAYPYRVQLRVEPVYGLPETVDNRYAIGTTTINIHGLDGRPLTDSIVRRNLTMRFAPEKGKSPVKLAAIRSNLYYFRGDIYSEDRQNFVQEQLGSMGIFSQASIRYIPRDTTALCDTLDVVIEATMDKPYDAEFEAKVTSKSNDQVGPGLSFGMTKRNAFRGAEKLKFEIHGSYEWQTNSSSRSNNHLLNSYEYGTELSLDYPRLIFPGGRKLGRMARTSTAFTLDATWMNRAGYFGMVSMGARAAYTYQGKLRIRHEFIPFRLDYNELLHTTATFDSIMDANQALYISMRNQFVPSMRYIFTYSASPKARHPRSFTLDVKESGNLLSCFYAAAGRPFTELDKKLFNVPFAQYIRLSAEFKETFRLTRRSQLATRITAGAIFSYGNALNAPYNDLFNIGGANSIRAFNVRGVGPGNTIPRNAQYAYVDQMGDIKFEANVEYRFPIVGNLFGATFLETGNVWLMRPDENRPGGTLDWKRLPNDLALGTGAGLRYDLDFIVLRFDVGMSLHLPYDTGRRGYFNIPGFKQSLAYHLAVGYPF